MKRTIKIIAQLAAVAGFMFMLTGCGTVPKGAAAAVQITTGQLQATGAGIVSANPEFTTYRIKCGVCGYETGEIVIPTPQAGKPYTLNWVCPKCGHKQLIVIQIV
jgi:ribosomal protein S27AE